jgi:hypothetical protein
MKTKMKAAEIKSICASGITIALTLTILAIIGVPAFATKEHHCTTGYQDCYDRGFQDGQSDVQNNVSIDWSVYDSHSSAWQHGYDDGVNSVKNTNIVDNSPSNTQTSTVNIRGDNNRVSVEQGQSISDGTASDGYGHHDGGDGINPECKVICLEIK